MSSMMLNAQIRTRLISAIDANDAWEVVESKESRTFNYFLEMGDEENENGGNGNGGK